MKYLFAALVGYNIGCYVGYTQPKRIEHILLNVYKVDPEKFAEFKERHDIP